MRAVLLATLLFGAAPLAHAQPPWPVGESDGTVLSRIAPPKGYARVALDSGSFGSWLRALPLRPGRPPVHLHDGRLKGNQEAQFAVVAIDVGKRDLQQCADAVMRLRAEYLRDRKREADLCFRYESGDAIPWQRWKSGERPVVAGNTVRWETKAQPDSSYPSFRRWMDSVFTYAGTASMARDTSAVPLAQLQPGDVFVQGGHPGHAVLVVDVAQDPQGNKAFLLAQSYMPAQEIHLLRQPGAPADPWFRATGEGLLETPEWTFRWSDLRRFGESGCAKK